MSKKGFWAAGLLTLIFSLGITGCFPKVDENENQSKAGEESKNQSQGDGNNKEDFPTYIEEDDIDNLSVSAQVVIPQNFNVNQTMSISEAKLREWDRESIVSKVGKGREVIETFSGENSGPNDMYYYYTFDDDSDLTFYSGKVYYNTKMQEEYQYKYYFDDYDNFKNDKNLEKVFQKSEINELDKNDAINDSDSIISSLDIGNFLGEPKVYSMDADTMNTLADEYGATDKYGNDMPKWEAEQEAYLVVYPVLYQNVSSAGLGGVGENEILTSPKAFFVYGREGMICFEIEGLYDVESTNSESIVCSPVDAVNGLKDLYKDVILDSEIEINLVRLTYVMRGKNVENVNEVVIEPIWLLDGTKTITTNKGANDDGTKTETTYVVMISGVTGKIIPLTGIGG